MKKGSEKEMKKTMIITMAAVAALSIAVFEMPAIAAADGNDQTTIEESTVPSTKSGRHEKKQKAAEPENAIGKEAAKAAALKDAGIAAENVDKIRSRVSKLEDGTVVYKVSFTAGEVYYAYQINALTGEVVDKSQQSAEEHAAAKIQKKENGKDKGKGRGKGKNKRIESSDQNQIAES